MPSSILLIGLFLALSHLSFAYIAGPRVNHHSTLIGNVLMIYGGQTSIAGGLSNTLIMLPIDQSFDTTSPPYGYNSGVSNPGLGIYGGVMFPGGENYNELLIYGGNNDGNVELSIYDQGSNSFNNIFQFNGGVMPYNYHSGVANITSGKAYIFGGTLSLNEDTALKGLLELDIVTFVWTMINSSSTTLARLSHTATLTTDGRMVVIGGQTNSGIGQTIVPMSNIDIFDTISQQWSNVNASNPPQARFSHTAVCTNSNQIIVFGGNNGNGSDLGFLGDLIVLDMSTNIPSWITPNSSGVAPVPRYGHSATIVGTIMFVIYGQISNTTLDSNIYALDTTTFAWTSNYTPSHLEYTWLGNNNSSLRLPIIIAIAAGSALVVGIIIFGLYLYRRSQNQKKNIARQEVTQNERDFFPHRRTNSRPFEDRQDLHRPGSFYRLERPSSIIANPIRYPFVGPQGNTPNGSYENFSLTQYPNTMPYAQNPGSSARSSSYSIQPENQLQTAREPSTFLLSQEYEPSSPVATDRLPQRYPEPFYPPRLKKIPSKEEIESPDLGNELYEIRYK